MTSLPEGVKATIGPRFNRDDPTKYFLAGNPEILNATSRYPNLLVAVNELKGTKAFDKIDRLCDERNVLLDSGIFNLAMTHARTHNVSHDLALSLAPEEIDGFDKLWDLYGTVIDRFKDRLWGAIELDQGGKANKPRTRAKIENEFGIIPIPVYHPFLDGWDYYDEVAGSYDRICMGNIVKASPTVRLRLMRTGAERSKQYPYLWTHYLGASPNTGILGLDIKGSMDSSSWLTGIRWYPSWKSAAMCRMRGNFPPDLWPPDGTGGGQIPTTTAILEWEALSLQATLDDIRGDTHTC